MDNCRLVVSPSASPRCLSFPDQLNYLLSLLTPRRLPPLIYTVAPLFWASTISPFPPSPSSLFGITEEHILYLSPSLTVILLFFGSSSRLAMTCLYRVQVSEQNTSGLNTSQGMYYHCLGRCLVRIDVLRFIQLLDEVKSLCIDCG